MSMSDCEKCWDTPCECGWEYKTRSKKSRLNLAAVILGIPVDVLASAIDSRVPDIHPLAEDIDLK